MTDQSKQKPKKVQPIVSRRWMHFAFVSMLLSLGLVGYAQWAGWSSGPGSNSAVVVQSRTVTFTADADGAYHVYDDAGTELTASTRQSDAFIGVIGELIAHERQVLGAGSEGPITIAQQPNGHITITDPITHLSIDLDGYKKNQVAAFARLLN